MKAVIQAGGKGTRISSLTGDKIPKPMLEIGGYPILYHQIMNLKKSGIKDITIIIGHLGNIIENYFKDGSSLGVNISYVRENPESPLGTAGALYYLKDQIRDDFIFLLADVFIDIDFKRMIAFHKLSDAEATLFVHPNAHPYDSDLVVCDSNNLVTGFDYKTNDRSSYFYHNLVNAGIMIFSANTLDYISENKKCDYEKNIIRPLINLKKVYAYKSSEYAKDIGTPERFLNVTNDYLNGLCNARNLQNFQKCIFLDRDGTINKHVGYVKTPDDFELLDGVANAIKMINESGYLAIVASNQPVLARGDATFQKLTEIHNKLDTLLGSNGAYLDDIYYCPHHPHKGFEGEVSELKIECECRKPNIGMINEAIKKYNIDPNNSFMIGDTTTDIMFAQNAKLTSVLVQTGEKGLDGKFDVEPDYVASDLESAVKLILKK